MNAPGSLRRRRAAAAVAAAVCALTGCAAGPDFAPPAPAHAGSFLAGGAHADARAVRRGLGVSGQLDALPDDWWTLLGSRELDTLVERALQASPTVEAARATLARTQELRRAGAGVFWPQASAAVAAGRQRALAADGAGPRAIGPFGLSTLSTSIDYSADVFGGQRRAVEALGAEVDRAAADLEAARIALAANVASAAIARAAYQEQAAELARLADAQDEQVRLALAQYAAGMAPYAPVLLLRSSRAATEAAIISLRSRAAQAETLLARLCGDEPGDAALPEITLSAFALPAAPPIELPAAWARHRPDIRGAEADLHAASAQVGVATAAFFPDVTITGQAGRAAAGAGSLFSPGTAFWSLQAALAATLFDGGARLHARRAALDAYDAAAAQYRQTVLVALQQVADCLQALVDDRDAMAAQAESAISAQRALELARVQWQAGRSGFLDVLVADE